MIQNKKGFRYDWYGTTTMEFKFSGDEYGRNIPPLFVDADNKKLNPAFYKAYNIRCCALYIVVDSELYSKMIKALNIYEAQEINKELARVIAEVHRNKDFKNNGSHLYLLTNQTDDGIYQNVCVYNTSGLFIEYNNEISLFKSA